jgi:hypothetical protein
VKHYQPDATTVERWCTEDQTYKQRQLFKAEATRRLDDLISTWVDIQRQISCLEGDGLFSLAPGEDDFTAVRTTAEQLVNSALSVKKACWALQWYVDGPVAERLRDTVTQGDWRRDRGKATS